MKSWDPKTLWDELRRALDDWMGEEPEQADDPSLFYHLCFTAPLVIGLLMMVRRA